MKKQQKIIELRTAAKREVANIKIEIAYTYSSIAGERAILLNRRAQDLKGLEANSTERLDVLADYRAKLADFNAQQAAKVAQLKYEIKQVMSECEQQCAAAEDDPEPETDTDTDVTVKGSQPRETVYCDGSEHSARIVARRLINKIPHIPTNGFFSVYIIRNSTDKPEYFVSAGYGDRQNSTNETFGSGYHTAEFEAAFVEKARKTFAEEPVSDNSHVAEPLSRALDAVFGGNPVEQVDNLIADTVKSGKEGGDE